MIKNDKILSPKNPQIPIPERILSEMLMIKAQENKQEISNGKGLGVVTLDLKIENPPITSKAIEESAENQGDTSSINLNLKLKSIDNDLKFTRM